MMDNIKSYQVNELLDHLNHLYPDLLATLLTKINPTYNRQMVQDNGEKWNFLKSALLRSEEQRTVYGVNESYADQVLYGRLKLFKDAWKEFEDLRINTLKIPEDLTLRLWNVYIPASEWIVKKREKIPKNNAYILGINGGQGSGKSTLVAVLKLLLKKWGYDAVTVSIDDYYLTYKEREELKERVPFFWARGQPGTHDVRLGIDTFRKLKNKESVEIPLFDKSLKNGAGDRLPKEKWQKVKGVDIVLFEGGWVGCRPLPEKELDKPTGNELIDSIEKRDDPKGIFRKIINQELEKYGPWFNLCNNLWVLKVSLQQIREGRRLQERKLRAEKGTGMTDEQVERFLDYWAPPTWRYILPLGESKYTDIVFEIDDNHDIKRVVAKK